MDTLCAHTPGNCDGERTVKVRWLRLKTRAYPCCCNRCTTLKNFQYSAFDHIHAVHASRVAPRRYSEDFQRNEDSKPRILCRTLRSSCCIKALAGLQYKRGSQRRTTKNRGCTMHKAPTTTGDGRSGFGASRLTSSSSSSASTISMRRHPGSAELGLPHPAGDAHWT